MHSSSKSLIKLSKCVGFGIYVKTCAKHAIPLNEKKVIIDYKECVGSGQCITVCQFYGVTFKCDETVSIASEKISEYTYEVFKDKPNFYINFNNIM